MTTDVHTQTHSQQQTQGQETEHQGKSGTRRPRQSGDFGHSQTINVGFGERIASVIGGAALARLGFGRRSIPGLLLMLAGGAMVRRGLIGHCSMYEAMDIDTAKGEPAAPTDYFERGIHVEESVRVNKSAGELFRFWRNFENLPKFMHYLESVRCADANHSHWVVKAPAGTNVEWDAEIINEEADRLIAWRSLGSAEVDNAGSVRFLEAPGEQGTDVKVTIDYIPPAGRVGWAVAKVFGRDPQAEVREDLNRFKQVMELGT